MPRRIILIECRIGEVSDYILTFTFVFVIMRFAMQIMQLNMSKTESNMSQIRSIALQSALVKYKLLKNL